MDVVLFWIAIGVVLMLVVAMCLGRRCPPNHAIVLRSWRGKVRRCFTGKMTVAPWIRVGYLDLTPHSGVVHVEEMPLADEGTLDATIRFRVIVSTGEDALRRAATHFVDLPSEAIAASAGDAFGQLLRSIVRNLDADEVLAQMDLVAADLNDMALDELWPLGLGVVELTVEPGEVRRW